MKNKPWKKHFLMNKRKISAETSFGNLNSKVNIFRKYAREVNILIIIHSFSKKEKNMQFILSVIR